MAGVGAAPSPEELFGDPLFWGKHLRADYHHDSLNPNPPYNIGGSAAIENVGVRGAKEFGEHTFWDYANKLASSDAEFKARMNAKIDFEIPTETAEFKPLPTLSVLSNDSIGIVMDAGANITKELGAQNVITFGMCIDAASSPVATDRNPIYFLPARPQVYIELREFGFDPDVIHGIWILGITSGGKAVKTAWVVGPKFYTGRDSSSVGSAAPLGYRLYNPIEQKVVVTFPDGVNIRDINTIRPYIPALGVKTVNDLEGDYAGKESAKSLSEQIGKTLGDAMIVASAMGRFANGTPNPFLGRAGAWTKLGGTDPIEGVQPTLFVVKTGDVLNGVRAIFKKVPVILERYRKNSSALEFEFYPGVVDAASIAMRIPESYPKIMMTVAARYRDLIQQFEDSLVRRAAQPVTLKTDRARFVGDSRRLGFMEGKGHFEKAGALFEKIIQDLGTLGRIVVDHFQRRQMSMTERIATLNRAGGLDLTSGFVAPPSSREYVGKKRRRNIAVVEPASDSFASVVADYNADLEHMKNLCPQTSEILRIKPTPALNPIIPITRVGPAGFQAANGTLIQDIEIRLITAFQAIADTARRDDLPNYANTLFSQRFTEQIPGFQLPVAPGGAAAAGAPVGGDSFQEELGDYVNDIIKQSPPSGGQRGGAAGVGFPRRPYLEVIALADDGRESISAKFMPLIAKFIEYTERTIGTVKNKLTILQALFEVISVRNSPRVVDQVLLGKIFDEFVFLQQTGIVNYPMPAPDNQTDETNLTILIYNAFAMSINNDNAMMYERDTNIGFETMEIMFRNKIQEKINIITPEPFKPGPSPVSSQDPGAVAPSPASATQGSDPRSPSSVATNLARGQKMWSQIDPLTGEPSSIVDSPRRAAVDSDDDADMQARLDAEVARGTAAAAAIAAAASDDDMPALSAPGGLEALDGGIRTPRRKKNRKATYRLKKNTNK